MTVAVLGSRPVRWGAVVLVAAWLLWMTLRPNETVAGSLSPLTTIAPVGDISASTLVNLAGNVVVYMPLGLGLALALPTDSVAKRWLLSTLAGAGLSLMIEMLQLVIPGRVSACGDWLLNTAGTALGAGLGCLICRRASVTPAAT